MATNDNNDLQELKSLISDRFDRLDHKLDENKGRLKALQQTAYVIVYSIALSLLILGAK
ncbi:MAG: hypothetical protein RLZZ381_2383 [Cyanobacteriota bacterium]|jgi:hypothetical protein